MSNKQRMENDMATTDRREMTDKSIKDNRIRNDQLTEERRDKADKVLDHSRSRNDEMTANRRGIKDENLSVVLTVFTAQILIALAVGIFLF